MIEHPVDGLDEIGIFGCPYHGLVTNGVLTLPNNTTIAWPQQPSGGDTLAVRRPGVPPVVRTPEDAASDAAAGHQWLTYGILAGRKSQLYGVPLASASDVAAWIYCAQDGSRWLVKLTSPAAVSSATNSATFVFSASRFGEFGQAAETYYFSRNLANLGQASPVLDFAYRRGSSYISRTLNTLDCLIDDVLEDGSRAILSLHGRVPYDLGYYAEGMDYPWPVVSESFATGFLEVSVSGSGPTLDINISVIRTRAQTLGSYSGDPLGNPESCSLANRIIGMWYTPDGIAEPVMLNYSWIREFIHCDPGGIAYSTCDISLAWAGVTQQTLHIDYPITYPPPPSDTTYIFSVTAGGAGTIIDRSGVHPRPVYPCAGGQFYEIIKVNIPSVNGVHASHGGALPLGLGIYTAHRLPDYSWQVIYYALTVARLSNLCFAIMNHEPYEMASSGIFPTKCEIWATLTKHGATVGVTDYGQINRWPCKPYATVHPVDGTIVANASNQVCFV